MTTTPDTRRRTCGGCAHLKRDVLMKCPFWSCTKSGFIVPQSSTSERTIFTRVPLACPLPVSEVAKSERPAAKKHWVEVKALTTPPCPQAPSSIA